MIIKKYYKKQYYKKITDPGCGKLPPLVCAVCIGPNKPY